MNSAQYQSLCLRTVPKIHQYWEFDFEGDVQNARAELMTNCALGLSGEAAEISELPSSDEIGDGYWYAYTLLWALNVESYEASPSQSEDHLKDAYYFSGKVCELVKKHVFHGREFNDILDPLKRATKRYVDSISGIDKQSQTETFAQNIGKLKKRYPEGFFERG